MKIITNYLQKFIICGQNIQLIKMITNYFQNL